MRGPRGLVLDEVRGKLYSLNKLSSSLSVIDTNTLAVSSELALSSYDPMPAAIRAGRGYLFDARLSGNGTVSCGICHMDADNDGLAWDLGDPGGEMLTVLGANLSVHDTTPRPRSMHPMKGPMVTQTLRGLQNGDPFPLAR
jgi:YVTN family beta-propeller protein